MWSNKMKIKLFGKFTVHKAGILILAALMLSSLILIINVLGYTAISAQYILSAVLFLFLLNLLAVLLLIHGSVHKTTQIVEMVFMGLLLVLTLVGNYYIFRINASINNAIIDTSKESKEEVETAFVVFGSSTIEDLNDVENKRFGIVGNPSFQEGYILPMEKLNEEKINVTYVEYSSYNELLLGLFNNEIDVASLPAAYYSMFINNEGYEEYLEQTKTIYSFTSKVTIKADENTSTKNLSEEPFSILVIGNADGMSDTLIVATFNPKTLTATMTSIARDSYIPIACYTDQASDKITHARAVSRDCTIESIENFMDLDIDYFVEVNFQAVVDIVDAVGGLYLYSPVEFVGQDASSERGNFTVWVGEGWQQMDGLQVLAFSRERKHMPNGDLDRQIHQQQVISAIIDKIMTTKDINTLVSVIDAAGDNVKTNLPLSEMTKLSNYLIQQLNLNTIKNNSILRIESSRVVGYSSWAYNEDMQLPLYIYKPYLGSVADNQVFIKDNLWIDFKPNSITSYGFDVNLPYFATAPVPDYYNEAEVHEKLPDFMPSMNSSSNPWTLVEVLTWSANRPWINIVYDEVWPGESGYSESYLYNQVISQSVKYGVKTSNFSTLNLSIIKHELDCSIAENRTDAQCKNIVPNFVGLKLSEVTTWSTTNNFPVVVEKILESDARYDKTKVGLVYSQLEVPYTKLSKLSVTSLTVYTMDYPSVSLPVATMIQEAWLKTKIEEWVKTNMYTTVTYVYETTNSAIPKDTVVGVKQGTEVLTQNTIIRSDNMNVIFTLSLGPAQNRAPVAMNAQVNISLATTTNNIYTGRVNATDADANTSLTYSLAGTQTTPATGTLVLNADGTFIYTVATGVVAGATDSFTFKANDGTVNSNTATVTITIAQ